jgi:hypothetical protein
MGVGHAEFEPLQPTMSKTSSIFEWTVAKHLRRLLKSSSDKDDGGNRPVIPVTAHSHTAAGQVRLPLNHAHHAPLVYASSVVGLFLVPTRCKHVWYLNNKSASPTFHNVSWRSMSLTLTSHGLAEYHTMDKGTVVTRNGSLAERWSEDRELS